MNHNMEVLMKPLEIDETKLGRYTQIATTNLETVPEEHRLAYQLAKLSLESKECKEPYELLLSEVLGVKNIPEKHGWDAVNCMEHTTEVYEFKPCSSNPNKPSGTINDDTYKKIEKCEQLEKDGKQGWLILAGIDSSKYSFDTIYKFPLEIYHEARRKYLCALMEKNKNQEKQTRSTFSITVTKSIQLCMEQNKLFYLWKRLPK